MLANAQKAAPTLPSSAVWRRPLLRFAVVLVFGLWIWQPMSGPVAVVTALATNVTLGTMTLGKGGHIALQVARPDHKAKDHDSTWDTRLILRIEGLATPQTVRVSPRRLLYLPLVFFLALLTALPIEVDRKKRALALGLPVLLAAALVSVWITAAWLFTRVPDLVYPASDQALFSFLYESLVTPLANKFLLPLFLLLPFSLPAVAPRAEAPATP